MDGRLAGDQPVHHHAPATGIESPALLRAKTLLTFCSGSRQQRAKESSLDPGP